MPEFFALSREDQREALLAAAERSGRPLHLLEKDVWVVWALRHLFGGSNTQHLVFKGGTSLSKAYGVIRRFSEDVDLTYDIRAIAPDLIAQADSPWPTSRSLEKKWSKAIQQRLADLVSERLAPKLAAALAKQRLPATARAEGERIFIHYQALGQGTGYVAPSVLLEFGARSTGEPNEPRPILCDAAQHIPHVSFPEATPQVMRPERTFWEKATAIHVFCARSSFRGGALRASLGRRGTPRYRWLRGQRSRRPGVGRSRRSAQEHLLRRVDDGRGAHRLQRSAVTGALALAPGGDARRALAQDYQRMVEDGLLLDDAEPFDALLQRCQVIADKMNAATRGLT